MRPALHGWVIGKKDRPEVPLFRAVFSAAGDPTIVRRLVAAGADPDLDDHAGQSPRGLADIIGNHVTSGYFEPRARPN